MIRIDEEGEREKKKTMSLETIIKIKNRNSSVKQQWIVVDMEGDRIYDHQVQYDRERNHFLAY